MKVFGVGIAVAVLVAAPPALAKGPDAARICGDTGCVATQAVEDVNVLALWTAPFDAAAEPAPAPFFTVDLTSRRGTRQEWSFLYVPSARAVKIIRADFSGGVAGVQTMNAWVTPSAQVLAAYERARAALAPFPASDEWAVSESDERSLPWTIVGLLAAAAAIVVLLLFSRRVAMRREARLAHD